MNLESLKTLGHFVLKVIQGNLEDSKNDMIYVILGIYWVKKVALKFSGIKERVSLLVFPISILSYFKMLA